MGGFEDKVRSVLSDTMNLPDDFLSMIPQYVAQNPVPLARSSGTRIASGQQSSIVTTTGTTFAGGVDVLTNPLAFTASGSNSYLLKVFAPRWFNTSSSVAVHLHINLDGADGGVFGFFDSASVQIPVAACGIISTPTAGSHTANARLVVDGGTGTIPASGGGFGIAVVTLEVF